VSKDNFSISVIVTCHNEEKFIEECIRSIINQSEFDKIIEIIVVNDSSEDNSETILNKLADECHKIKIIKSNARSLSRSRNLAIEHARGQYIAILDGDDYWTKNKIEIQIKAFSHLNEKYGLIYTNFIDLDEKKILKKITVNSFNLNLKNQLEKYFCIDGPIIPSTILVKSEIFKTVGKFDENLKYYEDTDFYLRVLEKYYIYHINDFSCTKRRHPNQITHKLSKLIQFGDFVINKAISRNNKLENFKKIRLSRNRTKAAIQSITLYNDKSVAFKLILESIKYKFKIIHILILIMILFPHNINNFIKNFIKIFIK